MGIKGPEKNLKKEVHFHPKNLCERIQNVGILLGHSEKCECVHLLIDV